MKEKIEQKVLAGEELTPSELIWLDTEMLANRRQYGGLQSYMRVFSYFQIGEETYAVDSLLSERDHESPNLNEHYVTSQPYCVSKRCEEA